MSEMRANQIREGFYSIEMDFVRGFLLVGDEEALLIDTGTGDGNLREFIEKITSLPLIVIFTHADMDHVGGADQFENCFMHPSEFDYYYSKKQKIHAMEPIWEGDIIDLGKYRLEVILIPGHTPGSIALFEREKRFLIGGDSIQTGNIYMFNNGRNFQAFRASMRKLQGMIHDFDVVYASHNELCVPVDTINRLYLGAGKVMEGKIEGQPEERFGGKVKSYCTDGIGFYAE